jgi:hypothetical protein
LEARLRRSILNTVKVLQKKGRDNHLGLARSSPSFPG